MSNYTNLSDLIHSKQTIVPTRYYQEIVAEEQKAEVEQLLNERQQIVDMIENYKKDYIQFERTNIKFLEEQLNDIQNLAKNQEAILNLTRNRIENFQSRINNYNILKTNQQSRFQEINDLISNWKIKVEDYKKKYNL